jgi:hypothetical protein
MSYDPETRPSVGNDVHQDPVAGNHPAPAPDNARSTGKLIASDKESRKAVYGADNKKIGSIERVMVDKTNGEIAYAVLSFGGFLGIGNDHYPVPWKLLRYDAELGGYRSDISENRLRGAPKHGTETIFDSDARYAKLDDYYNDEVIRPG